MSGEEQKHPDPDSAAQPADESAVSGAGLIDAFTAGGRLKAAREGQGRTLDDVAKELKVNWRVLEALERTTQPPDYDMRRTRLLAKTYAKILHIDAERVLADFPIEEEQDLATAIPKSSVTVSERKRGQYLIPVAAIAGAVVSVGLSVMVLTPRSAVDTRSTPSVAERVVAVNTAQESLFAAEPVGKRAADQSLQLAIVATKPAWIEVRGADGTIFRSRVMARGEAYFPRLGAGWTVTVQDGSAFEWRVEDEAVGRLSEEATPIYSASVDEAATEAAERASPAMVATSNARPAR